jgi:N-acetylglucosamine-6-phosphate deacetylase
LIADLEHLPKPMLTVFTRALGAGRTILTSDAVHLSGLPPGHYKLGEMEVELKPSGRICLSGTDLLAGSSLMLLQGIVNASRVTDLSLQQAFASATTVPAKALGVRADFAPPAVGKKANFVLFDVKAGKAHAQRVYLHGARIA